MKTQGMAAHRFASWHTVRDRIGWQLTVIKDLPVSCRLVLLAVVLAPMTGLRIWKVGPAELLCLVGCLIYLLKDKSFHISSSYLLEFWSVFLGVMFCGFFFCSFFYPRESDIGGVLTWIYFAIISITCYDMFRSCDNLEDIVIIVSVVSICWYLFLFWYSEHISSRFLNAPLWYWGVRFTGGGKNPHQVALLMTVTTTICFGQALNEKSLQHKVVLILFVCIGYYLLRETQSSTGQMSLAAGIAFALFSKINNKEVRYLAITIVILFSVLFSEMLFERFTEWVMSDKNGTGRFELFATILEAIDKSPLFGLGPGNHADGGTMEFHNTYLEIIAMTGVLGVLVFFMFSIWILQRVVNNNVCLSTVISLYVFGFAGFGMRRLVYWLLLVLVIVLAENSLATQRNGLGNWN